MKKTITVNLNGRVFNIDEDAYGLLDNYLQNLRIYFRKEEGSTEIIADFEARIEELFSEKIRSNYDVINIELVEQVITRVGKPSDFEEENAGERAEKEYENLSASKGKKKFYRNNDDKIFAGICSGIAAYFGWEVLVLRLIFALLLFATSGWAVPVYLLAWLIVPAAKTAEEKLQMRGEPITVENIGKTVAAEAEPEKEKNGCLASSVDFIGAVLKVGLVCLACLISLPLLFALFIVVVVLFSVFFGLSGVLFGLDGNFIQDGFFMIDHPVLATFSLGLLVGIPLLAIIYAVVAYFSKLKPLHKAVKWIGVGVWIVALILFSYSGIKTGEQFHRTFQNWNFNNSIPTIDGDGIAAETEIHLNVFEIVKFGENLNVNVRLENTADSAASVLIAGDSNIIDKISINQENGKIEILPGIASVFKSVNPLFVTLRTPNLKEVIIEGTGNVNFPNQLNVSNLKIGIEGMGNLSADSLSIQNLVVSLEGMSSVFLQGFAETAQLKIEGMGNINAANLISGTVTASVEGMGNISCHPVRFLEGRVDGAGRISYKVEPEEKNIVVNGLGSVGKE